MISQPNLTHQKANNIVKAYLAENKERISTIKYKLAKKFELIHYIYSFLYVKCITESTLLELKKN